MSSCVCSAHFELFADRKKGTIGTKFNLPSQSPSGVKRLREEELVTIRGDGFGERKIFERIYDYGVYNDIGDPDGNDGGKRPVLGGKKLPYPRRCRTGRPRSKKDPLSESKSDFTDVPRDEAFSEIKELTFNGNTFYSVLHAVVPALRSIFTDTNLQGRTYVVARGFSRTLSEWPLKSKLDPKAYGPPESAEIEGLMTVEEAIEQNKFILDYHDLLLPFVNKVNELKGTVLYGSRTLFFLTPNGTLRPLAIELTRPPVDNKPQEGSLLPKYLACHWCLAMEDC
ncbi:Linoleate 13S-lipoxygenase 2-1, chloroplastic [Capsicum annuum]|nr:Linoleate 13S-lipoxygenase 2-1, chloroplastic [Capsicum annuum]